MRLFVAVPIGDDIKRSLEMEIETLRGTRAPVRWVKPESMHLTLKFLGDTSEAGGASLAASLADAASGLPVLDISVTGLGAFPGLSNPRVVWAGVEDRTGALAKLYKTVDEAAAELGWDREKRGFTPHLTIGRVKGNINLRQLGSAIAARKNVHVGNQIVSEFSIYRSQLRPDGTRYEALYRFPLGV